MRIPEFLAAVLDEKLALDEQEEFLRGKEKFTAKELCDAVLFLRAHSARQLSFPKAIDVCGTGGSGLNRFNTSTVAAFVLAALGVKVAKHGNRAGSGRFGSFDLLEKLGIPFDRGEELYRKYGLVFLFAPEFYPVMKHFASVRVRIGRPTFFNLLGPLLNPAGVCRQVIGTAFREKMELMAETCRLLGKEHVFIVCGEDGLDEVTLSGKTFVVELKQGKIRKFTLTPQDFALPVYDFSAISGGDGEKNTLLALALLEEGRANPQCDLVCANTALGLLLAGKVAALREGVVMAKGAFESGKVREFFQKYTAPQEKSELLENILRHKRMEVEKRKKILPFSKLLKNLQHSKRDFLKALQKPNLALIAEIKRRSPAAGEITKNASTPAEIAQEYEENGAAAISVLCDEKFFGGSLQDLSAAAKSTKKTPILCKDFLIDEYQIYEARRAGADAMLILAMLFPAEKIEHFLTILRKLKMEAIVEVHTAEELRKALQTSAKIIGMNNRDLRTFQIDLSTTAKLAPLVPADRILISESGIQSRIDILSLPASVQVVLVGTAIMERSDRAVAVQEFSGARPLLKICGIRDKETAQLCEADGIDLVGFNFVAESKRKVTVESAKSIRRHLKKNKVMGVFRNQMVEEVNRIVAEVGIHFIQLCGNEPLEFVQACSRPVLFTVSLQHKVDPKKLREYAPYVSAFIFDGPAPGSGKRFDPKLLPEFSGKFFVAGGVTPQNFSEYLDVKPFGIDVASGMETDGKIDPAKIRQFMSLRSEASQ